MHHRLGSTTLLQLAFPQESILNLNFPQEKSQWENIAVKKKKKIKERKTTLMSDHPSENTF